MIDHVTLRATDRAASERFYARVLETLGIAVTRADAPGPRPEYGDDCYGGFLLDPDGTSAEAVHHDGVNREGNVDHVWIRVADVAGAKRFYEMIAPFAGIRLGTDEPERAQFRCASGRSPWSPASRRSTSTSRSGLRTTRRSTRSTAPPWAPAIATTARRASVPSTTPATTARSCSTRTATTSSWCTTTARPEPAR